MTAVSIDIKDLIEAGTSLVFKTDLFIGREPTSPHNTVTIFDVPGAGPFLSLSKSDPLYDYAAFQIRVRNTSYPEAFRLSNELIALLHGDGNKVINGTTYTLIEALDSPALLDYDENNRPRVIVNYGIQRT